MKTSRLLLFSSFIISLIIIGAFFVFPSKAKAASFGEQVNFYVDKDYDANGRSNLSATLRVIGDFIYIYIENDYWNKLDANQKNSLLISLSDLANVFDKVIYPKERAAFGSEWSPGIDNDARITLLITNLLADAAGYVNIFDEYPKDQVDGASNEREMIYLNASRAQDPKNKAFLAHEFQHLITFYQKTKLFNIEEEVWLNEARSEYAVTLCGFNDTYQGSYLSSRVGTFLNNSSDSLTEWQNLSADYGTASMFIHYLAGRYGNNILTRMVLNNKIGIASIEQALVDLGYSSKFSDIFSDWIIASYLNNCQLVPQNIYCYQNNNLTYERVHTDYTVSYSGFPNLIVSRSASVKDWSPHWYRFNQSGAMATDKDTLKLEFIGSTANSDFRVPYFTTDLSNQTTVQFIPLSNQKGTTYIPNFSSLNKTLIMAPFNQYRKSGFSSNEPLASFSFTASSISAIPPTINNVSPSTGSTSGGFDIIIKGGNLSSVKTIVFGQAVIVDFSITDDATIVFTAPASVSGGFVDLKLVDKNDEQIVMANAFNYNKGYPDGSLIRARGDYKVYVLNGGYKRWIQDSRIFSFYGHMSWQSIIEVSSEERDSYQDSWLVRAANDPRVYEINGDLSKHWLNMTAEEFSRTGRLWDMVYIINSSERDLYRTGPAVMYQ